MIVYMMLRLHVVVCDVSFGAVVWCVPVRVHAYVARCKDHLATHTGNNSCLQMPETRLGRKASFTMR
jgi:hypothetical protein